jgi:SnoaL-like domain
MRTEEAAARWIEVHRAAWAEQDPERTAVLFAEDCVYSWHPFREPRVGAERVASYVRWAFTAQKDVHISFGEPLLDGTVMAVEYWMTFVQVEEAKPFTIAGAQIVEFNECGQARSVHDYWHSVKGKRRMSQHDHNSRVGVEARD